MHYGDFEFNLTKFPDPAGLVRKLKSLSFETTLWVTPFFATDSSGYKEAEKNGYLVMNSSLPYESEGGQSPAYHPALVYWWDGPQALDGQDPNSGVLDVTNSHAREWFITRLLGMIDSYGVAGFKLDAGETAYLPSGPEVVFAQHFSNPLCYTQLWAEVAADPRIGGTRHSEVRSSWQNQVQSRSGLLTRVFDELSDWSEEGGFGALLPRMLTFSTLGYRYALGDMIGGNGYIGNGSSGYVLDGNVLPPPELYVRWAQMFTLLPMQFSFAPWQYTNSSIDVAKHINAVFALREQLMPFLQDAASEASRANGAPVLRPLWTAERGAYPSPANCRSFLDKPGGEVVSCQTMFESQSSARAFFESSQFLVGDSVMFAPITAENVTSRIVYFPGAGTSWKRCQDDGFATFSGQEVVNVPIKLNTILCFLRKNSTYDANSSTAGTVEGKQFLAKRTPATHW